MTLFLIRIARLLLYLALLGESIFTLMNGAIFLANKVRGFEGADDAKRAAVGLVLLTATFLLDSQARRAERRLELKHDTVRGFEVVISDKTAPSGKDRDRH